MTQPVFIGIDVGTSSVKVIAVDPSGKLLATAASSLEITRPQPGWSEQNPEDWWIGSCLALRRCIDIIGSPEILSIGLSGQMHSLVPLDKNGAVVRPAILWNDVRTIVEVESIRKKIGNDSLRRLTGNPALEGFTAPKLMWVRDNEPDCFNRFTQILLAKDYIRFRLTGELSTDPSDASGTLLFDVAGGNWSEEMCSSLGIDSRMLPPIIGSSNTAGSVTKKAASQTGIPAGVTVVTGGSDNACAAVGAGVVSPGNALITIGTSGAVVAVTDTAVSDAEMRVHSMCHALPSTWYLMGVVLSAGASLDWWRRTSGRADYNDLIREAEHVEVGSGGVTFLPYLNGERTPHADADARSVFLGMHAGIERGHMTRAVLEGVSYALKDSLELMNPLGVNPVRAVAVGGGAKSPVWLHILSDVLNLELRTVGPSEGAPLGAAMLAAVGHGAFCSPGDAVESWLFDLETIEPDPSVLEQYAGGYDRYVSLYPLLKPVFTSNV